MSVESQQLLSNKRQLCQLILWLSLFLTLNTQLTKTQLPLEIPCIGELFEAFNKAFVNLFLLRVYAQKESVDKTVYALDNSAKFLKELERYAKYTYELPKMYSAAIPDFAAGKEKFKSFF